MPVPRLRPAALGRPSGALADVAFRLGDWREREGDLEQAAGWFRRAAESDRPDAALRLGDVLGRLAEERRAASGDSAEVLLAEATRWLSEARDATTPAGIELITDMLNRHQRQAASRGLQPAGAGC